MDDEDSLIDIEIKRREKLGKEKKFKLGWGKEDRDKTANTLFQPTFKGKSSKKARHRKYKRGGGSLGTSNWSMFGDFFDS